MEAGKKREAGRQGGKKEQRQTCKETNVDKEKDVMERQKKPGKHKLAGQGAGQEKEDRQKQAFLERQNEAGRTWRHTKEAARQQ
jgi:hypothetical protein